MRDKLINKLESIKNNQYVFLIWQIVIVLIFYLILGMDWILVYTKPQIFIYAILGLLVMLIVHEMVHYLFIRLFTKAKVNIGFINGGLFKKRINIQWNDKLKGWQNAIVGLAPILILTIIPTFFMLLKGYRSMFMYSFVMLNFVASYSDIIDGIKLFLKKESNK